MNTKSVVAQRRLNEAIGWYCVMAILVATWLLCLGFFVYSGNWWAVVGVTLAASLAFSFHTLGLCGIAAFLPEDRPLNPNVFFIAGMLSCVFGVSFILHILITKETPSHAA